MRAPQRMSRSVHSSNAGLGRNGRQCAGSNTRDSKKPTPGISGQAADSHLGGRRPREESAMPAASKSIRYSEPSLAVIGPIEADPREESAMPAASKSIRYSEPSLAVIG